jgi:hypothetical protein
MNLHGKVDLIEKFMYEPVQIGNNLSNIGLKIGHKIFEKDWK